MPLFRRYEGDPVVGEGATRAMEPYLMPSRTGAQVFFDMPVEMTRLLAYLERVNAGGEKKLSFFHIALCAMVRAMGVRPKSNRFIVGHKLYQRKWIDVSFAVKEQFNDHAPIRIVKVRFDKNDTLADVVSRVDGAVAGGRKGKKSASDHEMELLLKLPRFLIRAIMWFLRWLDAHNLLPAGQIQSDQLYTSIFVANLGSIGIDAPFHHLYEWGTAPVFCAIGMIQKEPVVDEHDQVVARSVCHFKYTFDERCVDGFYMAKGLNYFKSLLLDPEQLEKAPTELPEGQLPKTNVA